jgi:DNA-binding beta-propeller fold protein YncE
VGDFPAAIALHPNGRHAVVLHCGYGPHEVAVLDVVDRKLVSRTRLAESFQGLAFSPDGSRLWVSGGAAETLLRFRFVEGALVPDGAVRLREEKLRGIPCGIGVAGDGTTYVANVWGHSVSRIRFPAEAAEPVARNRSVPVGSRMITVGNAWTPNCRQVSG